MILNALLSATLFVKDLNARCNVRKLLALNALFIVKSLSALSVAPRINVKRKVAPSVNLFANLLVATPLARLLNLNVNPFVKNSLASTNVLNLPTANVPNVNCNARNLLVKNLNAALVQLAPSPLPSLKPTLLALLLLFAFPTDPLS